MTDVDIAGLDAARYRQVLGQYPTGVCVITGLDDKGRPLGLTIGSFTSLSLDPPLVAFMPDKRSTSWARMRPAGSFCVNVLAADQEPLCRTFASRSLDKFYEVPWHPATSGAPILGGAVAWIDCDVERIHDAGDHEIVIGAVRNLDVEDGGASLPLLFFRGGYGRFTPKAMVAGGDDLRNMLTLVDLARSHMDAIVTDLGVELDAVGMVGREMVLLATAGPRSPRSAPTAVGQRIPALPPVGSIVLAWQSPEVIDAWLEPVPSPEAREVYRRRLDQVRNRGYSVFLRSPALDQLTDRLESRPFGAHDMLSASDVEILSELAIDPLDFSPADSAEVSRVYVPIRSERPDCLVALGLRLHTPPADQDELSMYVHRLQQAADVLGQHLA